MGSSGMRLALLLCATGIGAAAAAAADVTEARTGLQFPAKGLSRLGVRYKGPIKVYAVGEYASGDYVLKMSYGVGAQKMSAALADALKPRCSDAKAITDFETCLVKGLPNGAPKGTQMVFSTGGSALKVAVNGKAVGAIGSKKLATAFANIYTDKNAVCKMEPVGAGGEVAAPAGGGLLSTPVKGAAIGAAVGYGLGTLLK